MTRELNHPKGGTTACVAVLLNDTIVVGNVGDTRAILYRGNSAVPLSKDHKPDRVDESTHSPMHFVSVFVWMCDI